MATVTYEQTLIREVQVEVTDTELAALRGPAEGQWTEEQRNARDEAQQAVVDRALLAFERENPPAEFAMANCLDEDDNELFDIG